jgi:O-antigen/teichoic acid export membrane protein
VLNLFAQIAPLVVAVIAVPVLIRGLGEVRFGILGLAWALIGYFGLFDFGISRALTQAASEALGRGDRERLGRIGPGAIEAMFALGAVGALCLAAVTPILVRRVFKIDETLGRETVTAFYLLAASLPFVLSTLGFRGLFEAHQHFGLSTALRLPFALFNYVGPLLVLPFTNSLVAIVGILVAGRLLTWAAHVVFGMREYSWLRLSPFRNASAVLPLLRIGGWMTVSNIISPMMVNLDRFLIGALLSMSAVAYYITPFEVVTKLLFVPSAIVAVFFPAFAATHVQDRQRTAVILERASKLILITVFPAALLLVAFSREGLMVWVGPDFVRESTAVLQLLTLGVFINSLGQVPFGLLQALGRPDLTAKLHMIELPLYAVMIFGLALEFGLVGVAAAWTLRIVFDTSVLCWLAKANLVEALPALRRAVAWFFPLSLLLALLALIPSLPSRAVASSLVLLMFSFAAWRAVLEPSERAVIRNLLRWTPRSPAKVS